MLAAISLGRTLVEGEMKRLVWLAMVALVVGCGSPEAEGPVVAKSDVEAASGKGDSADLDAMCADLEREPGCDPCSVQGWYGDGSCDEFCPVRDSDCGVDAYTINVDLAAELGASMSLIYQSTKDSFGCTDLTFDEGNFKRVPEQVRTEPDSACAENADGTSTCEFTFSNTFGDGCKSVIRHIYLEPRDSAGTMEPWASLAFLDDFELAADAVQVVECQQSNGLMMCGNDLMHYDATGSANVSLVMAE